MLKSAKLDRFRRRIDLEAKLVFLISAWPNGSAHQHNCCCELPFGSHAECEWALIMRAIKCRKGIWWMPWR